MKLRHLVVPAVAAGALMISASASAALIWQWAGNLTQWQANPITDGPPPPAVGVVNPGPGDGDTTFTVNNTTFPDLTSVTLQEYENPDFYSVGLDFSTAGGTASSGTLGYTVKSTEPLSQAFLDSVISPTGGGNVTKVIYASEAAYNAGANPLLTLTSINGGSDSGKFTNGLDSFYVLDTINSGAIHDLHNHFVPDPGTLSLLGIGMVGLGARRRMTKKSKA